MKSPLAYMERIKEERFPFRFLLSRLLWVSGLCRYFQTSYKGCRLHFFPTSLSASLWTDPDCRNADIEVLNRLLRPGNTVVDVGANIGSLALSAGALVAPNGHVHAIEGHPKTYLFLEKNVQLNALPVKTYHAIIGESCDRVKMTDRRADDQNQVLENSHTGTQATPLEDLIDEPQIDLLKIDVEGYEMHVLKGCQKLLPRVQNIYVECIDENLKKFGSSASDLALFLKEAGFSLFVYHPQEKLFQKLEPLLQEGIKIDIVATRKPQDLET